MKEPYRISKLGWTLLIIGMILTLGRMTGIATGLVLDVAALVVYLGAIIVVGIGWYQHSQRSR